MQVMKRIVGAVGFWMGWPLWWLLLRRSERTRVLVRCNDAILLVLPTLSMNRWSLPGGGLRHGEDAFVAASRELYEELKLVLAPEALQPLKTELLREDSGLQYRCHYLIASLVTQPVLTPSLEIASVRWEPLETIDAIPTQQVVQRALALSATQ